MKQILLYMILIWGSCGDHLGIENRFVLMEQLIFYDFVVDFLDLFGVFDGDERGGGKAGVIYLILNTYHCQGDFFFGWPRCHS